MGPEYRPGCSDPRPLDLFDTWTWSHNLNITWRLRIVLIISQCTPQLEYHSRVYSESILRWTLIPMTGKKVQNIHITGFLLNIMKEKKVNANLCLLPQRCFPRKLTLSLILNLWPFYRSDSLTIIVPREFSLCKATRIPVADVLRKSSLISNADKQFVELCCYMCS